MFPRYSVGFLALFIICMLAASLYFLGQVQASSYLVNQGVSINRIVSDYATYNSGLQGMVFSAGFLLGSLLLIVFLLIPNQEIAHQVVEEAPQPEGFMPPKATATIPSPMADAEPVASPAVAPTVPIAPVVAMTEEHSRLDVPPASQTHPEKTATQTLEEELEIDGGDSLDEGDIIFKSEESDVIFGSGKITTDSLWSFVHGYPESAIKYLYNKTVDNKTLPIKDSKIHHEWTKRGMSRRKILSVVLETMNWDKLPADEPPHSVWRMLRDRVMDLRG